MRRAFPAKEAKEGVGVPNMRLASKFAEQAFVGSSPCALVRPPRGLLGTEWELVWMSGDSELDLGGRLLEWWSPGEEGVVQLRSAAGSCKKVRSGAEAFIMGAVDQSYLIILLPFMAYHTAVRTHHACCPRKQARSNSYAKNRSNLYAKNRSNSTRKTGAQIIRFDPGPKTEPMNLDRPITYCFAASSTDLTHSSHPHPNPHELVCLPVAVVCIVEVRWRFSRQDP
ncbi:hypothetical protein BHE74_00005088 [Ensete ventricosum]|nr:hypothetical protein BHE74_00005088 [Ensete ventricosum]